MPLFLYNFRHLKITKCQNIQVITKRIGKRKVIQMGLELESGAPKTIRDLLDAAFAIKMFKSKIWGKLQYIHMLTLKSINQK